MTTNLVKKLELSATLNDAITGKSAATGLSNDSNLEFREVWTLPKITRALRNEARRQLVAAEDELEPAKKDHIRKWLTTFGALCSGNKTPADAKEKLSAFSNLLSNSSAVFTKETLELAGRKFTWYPSYSELSAFLDELEAPIRNRAERLSMIAKAPIPDEPQPKQEPLDERRAHAAKVMREFTESMKTE